MTHSSIKFSNLLLLLSFFLSLGGVCAEPTGWDPDNAYEVDPCVWAIVRIHDYFEGFEEEEGGGVLAADFEIPTAQEVISALETDDQMLRLAKSVDAHARRLLGMNRDPISKIQFVRKRDVPSWDDRSGLQALKQAAPMLTPWFRRHLNGMARNPESRAFNTIQRAMIDRRIAEIRYSQEASDPAAMALFKGAPVPVVHLVGGLFEYQQRLAVKNFLADRKKNEPVMSLVWDTTPLYPGPLADLSSIVRVTVGDEDNPLANNGQHHFNTDRFRYTGMFESANGWHCGESQDILEAVDSAFSFPGRDQVVVEVPLTSQFIEEYAEEAESLDDVYYTELAYYLGGLLTKRLALQARSSGGVEYSVIQQAIRDTLLEVAVGLTKNIRVATSTGNQPGDILDEPKVVSPQTTFGSGYSFIFSRRDGKRIEVRFTGPDNLLNYVGIKTEVP